MAAFGLPFLRRKTRLDDVYNLDQREEELGALESRDAGTVPAPICSVSVGTAGMARNALWARKMGAVGCGDRVQSLVAYDYNRTGINGWLRSVEKYGLSEISVVPSYLPLSEGFLRRPDDYERHAGPIERDMERMVDRMQYLADRAWSRPQVIILWLGFGGHARLSFLMFEQVVSAFPNAQVLPVFCMPDERVLEANIRDYRLWEEACDVMGDDRLMLITDNRVASDLSVLDERVAVGLAAVEAAYRFRAASGTLAEVVSVFGQSGSRWLSLDTAEMPYRVRRGPLQSRRGVRAVAGNSRRNTLEGKTDVASEQLMAMMAHTVKEKIWEIADPANDEGHTAFHRRAAWDGDQRIYVMLPFHRETVECIREDVEDNLAREMFSDVYEGTNVYFAAGDAAWRERGDFRYGHIVKLAGLSPEQTPWSLSRVLDGNESVRRPRRRFLSRRAAAGAGAGTDSSGIFG